MSAYVSIGRNVRGLPMSDSDWADFIGKTTKAVETFAGPLLSVANGIGSYDGEREHTAIIVGQSPNVNDRQLLRFVLAKLAALFGQECIALSFADTELVAP